MAGKLAYRQYHQIENLITEKPNHVPMIQQLTLTAEEAIRACERIMNIQNK